MANPASRQRTYQTYGSVAYQDRYDGSAVRAPRRQQEVQRPLPQQRPRVQPRERVRERPRVEVRPAGAVAPFAVIGFFVVALCAALLVVSCAQLAVINDQTVRLKTQLTELKTAETVLLAQYELAYDLPAIEAQLTAGGSMVKLQPSQITYLDISAPDSVVVYSDSGHGLGGIVSELETFFSQLLS